MAGLEQAAANGHDITTIASVASFFVSRVDTEVDKRLTTIGTPEAAGAEEQGGDRQRAARLRAVRAAAGHRRAGAALAAKGAKVQRPLWASTSTKDPSLPDTLYVVDLVTADTVNTMPEATLHATADHGVLRATPCTAPTTSPGRCSPTLEALGISYDDVVQVLEDEGVSKFEVSWGEMLATIKNELSLNS